MINLSFINKTDVEPNIPLIGLSYKKSSRSSKDCDCDCDCYDNCAHRTVCISVVCDCAEDDDCADYDCHCVDVCDDCSRNCDCDCDCDSNCDCDCNDYFDDCCGDEY